MNKKGQALVEFVLIIPVLVMLLFCIIDFGKILASRIRLESKIDKIISLYEKDLTYDEIKKIITKDEETDFKITNKDNKYVEFSLAEDIEIITPGLNSILGSNFKSNIKRVVYYE